MSIGLMCDCPLPPMAGLTVQDRGHTPRVGNRLGCPNYAADQERGGRCAFCADAEAIGHIFRARLTEHSDAPDDIGAGQ